MCLCVCPCEAVISSEAVTSGGAVVQQPLIHTQTALITSATTIPATQVQYYHLTLLFASCILTLYFSFLVFKSSVSQQVEIVGKPQPAAPSQPATPGTEHELQQYRKSLCLQCPPQVENLFPSKQLPESRVCFKTAFNSHLH